MLIATGSLDSVAKSYGVETSKGYLPHCYLQNCESTEELLRRLHNPVKWKELEPHMSWFHDAKDK